jgi:hypothetical protein
MYSFRIRLSSFLGRFLKSKIQDNLNANCISADPESGKLPKKIFMKKILAILLFFIVTTILKCRQLNVKENIVYNLIEINNCSSYLNVPISLQPDNVNL